MNAQELREAAQIVESLVESLDERRAYRDSLILRAIEEDVPYRKIAEITGVTYGRIGQIAMVNKARTAQL